MCQAVVPAEQWGLGVASSGLAQLPPAGAQGTRVREAAVRRTPAGALSCVALAFPAPPRRGVPGCFRATGSNRLRRRRHCKRLYLPRYLPTYQRFLPEACSSHTLPAYKHSKSTKRHANNRWSFAQLRVARGPRESRATPRRGRCARCRTRCERTYSC